MVGHGLPVLGEDDAHRRIVEEAIEAVLSTVDLRSVLDRTGQLLRRHFGETRVAINRISPTDSTRAEVVLVSDPRQPSPDVGTSFPLAGSAAGKALADRKPCVLDPLKPKEPRFREEPLLAAYGYGSLVSFPLVFEGEQLGTLDIAHPPREGLLACCFEVARQVAHLVAIALHNSLMVEEVQRLNRLLGKENALLKEEIRQIKREARYVAESPQMKEVVERIRLVAPSTTTVLIRGETGTGKEGLARMVHEFSPRFNAPFVPVNLGAIPEGLVESELFGHEKGAFTGANRRRQGRFEQADGGTIFLDEVGDAPPSVQVRLLRVLQERVVERVGGTEAVTVDVRVVAATNRNLEEMVARGTFRADLYYRLDVVTIRIPPLRERREDIPLLAEHFAAKHGRVEGATVSPAARELMAVYDWPGNVRELENALERALIFHRGDAIGLADLPETIRVPRVREAAGLPVSLPESGLSLEEVEKELILRALQKHDWNQSRAARYLGITRHTLLYRMEKHNIVRPGGRAAPAEEEKADRPE